MSANSKLYAIDTIYPIPVDVSAERLGELLNVTGAAIKKTDWWTKNRKGRQDELADKRFASTKLGNKIWNMNDLISCQAVAGVKKL